MITSYCNDTHEADENNADNGNKRRQSFVTTSRRSLLHVMETERRVAKAGFGLVELERSNSIEMDSSVAAIGCNGLFVVKVSIQFIGFNCDRRLRNC